MLLDCAMQCIITTGLVPNTRLRATFDVAVHDIPEAVHAYCRGKGEVTQCYTMPASGCCPWHIYFKRECKRVAAYDRCIKDYKALVGPLTFGASVLIPLVVGEFKLVAVSGPWKVELFEMPFDQVAKAIKELWDNHVGPAMENSLNAAGEGVEAAVSGQLALPTVQESGQLALPTRSQKGLRVPLMRLPSRLQQLPL